DGRAGAARPPGARPGRARRRGAGLRQPAADPRERAARARGAARPHLQDPGGRWLLERHRGAAPGAAGGRRRPRGRGRGPGLHVPGHRERGDPLRRATRVLRPRARSRRDGPVADRGGALEPDAGRDGRAPVRVPDGPPRRAGALRGARPAA
ncbi:MAG: Bacillosamine/Legionaminic acid biosynthesis aminotransferase PglE; 4-keto-6-deoxy-N-Acetyl-D-hexosaminyl-(Lipid carrier) aminotransferase, partial [uncultured Thermoleophilia bacterium]